MRSVSLLMLALAACGSTPADNDDFADELSHEATAQPLTGDAGKPSWDASADAGCAQPSFVCAK